MIWITLHAVREQAHRAIAIGTGLVKVVYNAEIGVGYRLAVDWQFYIYAQDEWLFRYAHIQQDILSVYNAEPAQSAAQNCAFVNIFVPSNFQVICVEKCQEQSFTSSPTLAKMHIEIYSRLSY